MDSDHFVFFVAGEKKPVGPGSRLWDLPLSGKNPGEKPGKAADPSLKNPSDDLRMTPDISIGDYFLAAQAFLSKNEFSILRAGLDIVFKRPVFPVQIESIIISLEKHGAFYHPLKIQVRLNNRDFFFFVLNGAVSTPGLALIEDEYHLIARLNKRYPKHYLPRVFGMDIMETDRGRVGFFIGEWFEGFLEFHLTETLGERQVVIWESDGTRHCIPETRAFPIYREISRILTYYYDIETFEQIHSWHHAAGDFILGKETGSGHAEVGNFQERDFWTSDFKDIHVRLVTARGYAPLTQFEDPGADKNVHILPSLVFFFLHLTLRMRLDRLDGTGSVAMAGERIIPAIVDGFLHSLDEKTLMYDHGDLRKAFMAFVRQFSPEQLQGILEGIIESGHPATSETAVILGNIESHCRLLHSALKNV
jgi:hypothetical protein